MRLADLATGEVEKEYYVCHIDRILDSKLSNFLGKWQKPDCPTSKLTLASMRKIEKKKGDCAAKM